MTISEDGDKYDLNTESFAFFDTAPVLRQLNGVKLALQRLLSNSSSFITCACDQSSPLASMKPRQLAENIGEDFSEDAEYQFWKC